jgi:alkylated DNA repair dioxygenase AlkB
MNAYLIKDVIANSQNSELLESLFEKLDTEVQWLPDITHQGGELPRKFALQCKVNENGDQPLYRHPMDQLPPTVDFTPTVELIRKTIESMIPNITLNHAIIQEYRDGNDHITEHADKTIDIKPGSLIVNYSVGEARTMKFRSKEPINHVNSVYDIQDMELINDSLCILDLETNRFYKHSIRQNKTIIKPRISITFRTIGTFYNQITKTVYGQGAPKKGVEPLTKEELLHAWSYENRSSDYTFEELYGRGYPRLGITSED